MVARWCVLVVIVLVLSACGVHSGEVTAKRHEDARRYPLLIGKVITWHTDDEDWILRVDGNDVWVERSTWESTQVGDWLDCDRVKCWLE